MTAHSSPARSRLVFVNRYFHPDESATSQLLSDLAFGLAERGWDVHVICSRQLYDEPRRRLAASESLRGVTVHRVPTTRFGRQRLAGRALDYLSFHLSCAWTLFRVLRPGDLAIAKTDPPLISIAAMAAARLRGARLINWLQDLFPEVASHLGMNPLPRMLDALLRRLRDRTLFFAETNVVIGERMRERLESLGVRPAQIEIVENWAAMGDGGAGAEIDRHDLPVRASALRARLGLAKEFVVAYSGNLGRAHDYRTVLEAARRLRDDRDVVFLMIGGGAGMAALRTAASGEGLDNFRFLPYQARADLADSLAAADVHWVSLLPSLEGLIVPSKAYGILAAARPMIFIGDEDGEVARLIARGPAGAVIAVGEAEALAAEIASLKRDPERCRSLGRNAYELYRRRFTFDHALRRWIDLLSARAGTAHAPAEVIQPAPGAQSPRLPRNAP